MITNIYMVIESSCDAYDGLDNNILGLYWDLRDAKKRVEKQRDIVLNERWRTTLDEAKNNTDAFIVEEGDTDFFIEDAICENWNRIYIETRSVLDRQHIDMLFDYDGKTYCEPVYIDDIDLNHYEDVWDWWFGPTTDETSDTDLNFELTADKSPVGLWSMGNAYINVYENSNSDVPIATIRDIKFRKSWLKTKAFTKASSHQK